MRLILDHIRKTVHTAQGDKLSFDRFYPLDDDHRFIVSGLPHSFLIEIRKGNKTVQRGVVRHLSVIAGIRFDGSAITRPYAIDLNPDKDIYPIAELVDNVLALDLNPDSISPMLDEEELTAFMANHASPQMVSDGVIRRTEYPASPPDLSPASEFKVSGASWVISFFGTPGEPGRHLHIYLWMHAAKHAEAVLDAIRQVQAGQLTPHYM